MTRFFLDIYVFKELWKTAFSEELMGIENKSEKLLLCDKFRDIIELLSPFIYV